MVPDANAARLVEQVQALLGPYEFEAAWQRGGGMTLDDVLEPTLTRFGRSRPGTQT